MNNKVNIYVGYDSRQDSSTVRPGVINPPYEVCKYSIGINDNVNIIPLKLKELINSGVYKREEDPLASTEFTYTRFLVPYLNNYTGIAIFCDSDFLWKCNVEDVLNLIDTTKAVTCVKHDYTSAASTKMDGYKQVSYPRKNWSSLMIFNCDHSDCRVLTPEVVNNETPQFLHRMNWASEDNIGELPLEYNWLEGDYRYNSSAKILHFTNGGPWHTSWKGDYAEEWDNIYNKILTDD